MKSILRLAVFAFLATACAMRAPISGFEPTQPSLEFQGAIKTPVVNSLRPTLSWKPFPGSHEDYGLSPKEPFIDVDMSSVESITYQLRVWNTENNVPSGIVLDKTGLEKNSYSFDNDLESGKVYFWSVRSEFFVNGERRLTEWSLTSLPHYTITARDVYRKTGAIPPKNYYRFRTP